MNDYYLNNFDIIETASSVEEELGIRMHLDIVFNDQMLNKYFNYDYQKEEDTLIINFEIEEGSASIEIYNTLSLDYNEEIGYDFNSVLTTHIENQGRVLY
jgi:hypothetical protein